MHHDFELQEVLRSLHRTNESRFQFQNTRPGQQGAEKNSSLKKGLAILLPKKFSLSSSFFILSSLLAFAFAQQPIQYYLFYFQYR